MARLADRQVERSAFVRKHKLRCFKCGASHAEWAKTGFSKFRPWAICLPCVRGEEARADD